MSSQPVNLPGAQPLLTPQILRLVTPEGHLKAVN